MGRRGNVGNISSKKEKEENKRACEGGGNGKLKGGL